MYIIISHDYQQTVKRFDRHTTTAYTALSKASRGNKTSLELGDCDIKIKR